MIKIGLVGLPNVGKSSLFRFLTQKESKEGIENYPFATIKPSHGIMPIPDFRLEKLAQDFQSGKVTPSAIEWVDIAGLVKGAAQGLGLGNEFLSHIREVDLICHVVRCFAGSNVEHVEKSVNPLRDYEIIQSELILADLQQIEKRKQKLQILQKKQPQQAEKELKILTYLEQNLMNNCVLFQLKLTAEQKNPEWIQIIKSYNLLTVKPIIIIANYNQEAEIKELENYAQEKQIYFFPLSVKDENDYLDLSVEEKKELGTDWKTTNLGLLAEKIKELLNLKVFFTAGPKETKSWLARKEMNAKQCAGLIHSDIEKGFVCVQVYNYQDWLIYPSEQQLSELGKIRSKGSQYIIQEGDICHFLFSAR
ncbi:redox-regulated ATPase YchF [endosymbiont GvMRE of Glomus versiforme]|uniref:redox-regulated ATPase YchF n=1 Tax=endosymbiont GvMRE of Glomus versiforme TaxID=2039283 RepID=UPI000ED777FF|nr:redox-regulated ATPase YchF [endosymbiont GvMRE of Glomus versiforme]RHZ37337.1 Ribosome-binding ATPase YchF [endosymbiont GvMRE of Glomus versiforme]